MMMVDRSLLRHQNFLKSKIILASGSPRRKQLLEQIGFERIVVIPSSFQEDLKKSDFESPILYVKKNAELKGADVASAIWNNSNSKSSNDADAVVLISADTVVICGDEILEKPCNVEDAKEMFAKMLHPQRNREHTVVTVFSLFAPYQHSDSSNQKSFRLLSSTAVTTKVKLAPLSIEEVEAYIASGEGKDKAAGYGIQGVGAQIIESIEGCYFNVMGLPLQRLSSTLAEHLAAGKIVLPH